MFRIAKSSSRCSTSTSTNPQTRRAISQYLYKVAKGMMPKISDTERAALNAGTVGFDRNIFSGDPCLKDLAAYKVPQFSPDEQAFMDKEVRELCEILDDYTITETRDMPEEFWTRCKKQGFFGMIIPKKYGGKGFSAHGHSQVMINLSSLFLFLNYHFS